MGTMAPSTHGHGFRPLAATDLELLHAASIRALEKAGFVHVGTFEDRLGPARLMVLDRPG
jgi:RimJ/RimL family protein N-acetyltransferase